MTTSSNGLETCPTQKQSLQSFSPKNQILGDINKNIFGAKSLQSVLEVSTHALQR